MNQLFTLYDVKKILEIQVFTHLKDELIWHFTLHVGFSIKPAYLLACNVLGQNIQVSNDVGKLFW